MEKQITAMSKEEILAFDPNVFWNECDFSEILGHDDLFHIAKNLDAFWSYDYEALKEGKPGMHAVLKSKLHSDTFFYSKLLLERENIRTILAEQIVANMIRMYIYFDGVNREIRLDTQITGIPDGATLLAEEIAKTLGSKNLKMEKVGGKIRLAERPKMKKSILLIDDFCTRGTGFKEAVRDIESNYPEVKILPFNMVILNRGGLRDIEVENVGRFRIVPVINYRMSEWTPEECPLCKIGSIPIKPKATDENWQKLTDSQK